MCFENPDQYSLQKVLFVDDDIRIRKSVSRLCQQYRVPWKFSFAEGVDDALLLLTEENFDAVIADIRMPGRDGFDLLTTLRSDSNWQDLPVAILTGLTSSSHKCKALDLGATDLLNKPVNPRELFARIRSMLRLKKNLDTIKVQNEYLEELQRKRSNIIERTQIEMIWRLGRTIENRGSETWQHTLRVGLYSRIVAQHLLRDADFALMVLQTSPLHDIGKIGIPDDILLKNGRLTAQEWKVMQTHCSLGEKILSHPIEKNEEFTTLPSWYIPSRDTENPFLRMAGEVAAYHHEQWSGGGYPYKLKGERIPLVARIVGICDVYDALRSNRVYKQAYSSAETIKVMTEESKTRFDPDVFAAFLQCKDDIDDVLHQYRDGQHLSAI